MTLSQGPDGTPLAYLVRVRSEPAGQFTAETIGLPDLRATADTREAAVERVRVLLNQRLASGELVLVTPDAAVVPAPGQHRRFAGHSKDDPDFDQYLEEIRRFRQEADQQESSSSSSTPTT